MRSRGATKAITGWRRCWLGLEKTSAPSSREEGPIRPQSVSRGVEGLPEGLPKRARTQTRLDDLARRGIRRISSRLRRSAHVAGSWKYVSAAVVLGYTVP